ncbi:hypothetical protein HDU76_007119, partial [Blyttiomyces sp. JEL0837]
MYSSPVNRIWKPKAFLNVTIAEHVVTQSSPLSGSVTLDIQEQLDAPNGIELVLRGVSNIAWTQSTVFTSAGKTRERHERQRGGDASSKLFSPATIQAAFAVANSVFGSDDGGGSRSVVPSSKSSMKSNFWELSRSVCGPTTFSPGSYTFPFSFSIAHDQLPAPFSQTIPNTLACEIRFVVLAKITQPGFQFAIKAPEVEFTPIPAPLNIRNLPPLDVTRSLSFLFANKGELVTVTLRSPRSTFTSGDDTGYFMIYAHNCSQRQMNELSLQLIQRVVLDVHGSRKCDVRRVLYKNAFPGLPPGGKGQKVVRVDFPACPPSVNNVAGISISYSMHLTAVMGLSISEVRASAPITIAMNGRGVIFSDEVQEQENEMKRQLANRGFVSMHDLPQEGDDDEDRVPLQPGPGFKIVSSMNESTDAPNVLENGARELKLDEWQSGSLSFQQTALYYFDISSDLNLASMDSFGDGLNEKSGGGSGSGRGMTIVSTTGTNATNPVVLDETTDSNDDIMTDDTGAATRSLQTALDGLPGVIVVANGELGVRISRDNVPTWYSYDLREESRTAQPDGSQEFMCRFSLGPGRYFVSVYGASSTLSSIMSTVGFKIKASCIRNITATDPAKVLGMWVVTSGLDIPDNAMEAGYDLDGEPLYVCRAWLGGGLHLGKVGFHMRTGPSIPYGGKEIGIDGEYELAGGVPANAIPAGFEEDGRLFYVGRAVVSKQRSWLEKRQSVCPGKAGPHLKCCNIGFDGKEMGITPFEVLVYDGDPEVDENSAEAQSATSTATFFDADVALERESLAAAAPPPL